MKKRPLKILVACASGIATSTLAASVVQEVCDGAGLEAVISKCNILDVSARAADSDVVLTTNKYREECPVPLMSIVAFVTGIREEETREKLAQLLRELAQRT